MIYLHYEKRKNMPSLKEEMFNAKKIDLMVKSFDCFAEYGLHGTGIRAIGKFSGCNPATLYTYFKDLDDLLIQSTAYCMTKVEDDFMARAPHNLEELWRFVDEIPYWSAEKHGKKYRLMYQIYTHPKYREEGKKFFAGVTERYAEYAKTLEVPLGIPSEDLTGLIYTIVRACVHFALFEDETYLKAQMRSLKTCIALLIDKNRIK